MAEAFRPRIGVGEDRRLPHTRRCPPREMVSSCSSHPVISTPDRILPLLGYIRSCVSHRAGYTVHLKATLPLAPKNLGKQALRQHTAWLPCFCWDSFSLGTRCYTAVATVNATTHTTCTLAAMLKISAMQSYTGRVGNFGEISNRPAASALTSLRCSNRWC